MISRVISSIMSSSGLKMRICYESIIRIQLKRAAMGCSAAVALHACHRDERTQGIRLSSHEPRFGIPVIANTFLIWLTPRRRVCVLGKIASSSAWRPRVGLAVQQLWVGFEAYLCERLCSFV